MLYDLLRAYWHLHFVRCCILDRLYAAEINVTCLFPVNFSDPDKRYRGKEDLRETLYGISEAVRKVSLGK